MQAERVSPDRVFHWFQSGWHGFTTAVGPWLLATLLFLVLAWILFLVPPVGNLILALIGPSLTGGFLIMARAAQTNESVRVGMLFQGLSDSGTRVPLLVLGLISLAGTLLGGLFMLAMGSGVGGAAPAGPLSGGGGQVMLTAGTILGMVVYIAIMIGVGLALLFGVPLVVFGGSEAGPAMQASIRACLHNLPAVLLFFLAYLVLAVVAAIPFGLGFFILIPVVTAAIYQAFREVFPESTAADPGAA